MKRTSVIGLLLAATGFSLIWLQGCGVAEEHMSKVVLIGLDGGSWNLLDPMLKAGELPHLAAVAARGVTAELSTVTPVISPTVWTSIATGRRPAAHGITSFFADRRAVRVPTLWERLAASGVRVGVYEYLLTWPPRHLPDGFMVSGWLRHDDQVTPADLFARLALPSYFYRIVDIGSPDVVIASIERELEQKPRYWRRLMETFDPQVGFLTFYAIDVLSHRYYHTVFPEEDVFRRSSLTPDSGQAPSDLFRRILRAVDRAIGEVTADLGDDDHVLIVSDHGFRPIDKVSRRWGYDPFWLLDKAEIDAERDQVDIFSKWIFLGFDIAPGPPAERDVTVGRLEQLLRSARTVAGEALFEVWTVREPTAQVDEASVAGLPAWMTSAIAERLPAHAFVFARGRDEILADHWPLGRVEVAGAGHELRLFAAPHLFTGDHDATGIFIAAGKSIAPRGERQSLSVLDIAPLMSWLADQPIPDDLEGTLPEHLLRAEHLSRRLPRRIAAADLPRLPAEDGAELGDESQEEIRERLRALGYVD